MFLSGVAGFVAASALCGLAPTPGVLVVARRREDGNFTSNDFAVFRSAAEQSSFAIGTARRRREETETEAFT